MNWKVIPLYKRDPKVMSWEDDVFENWLQTYYTPLPLDKVWSIPTEKDNLSAIRDTKEWLHNHRDEEPRFEVNEMGDGTYFAPEQFTILQALKDAGRVVVLCHIQEYHHTSEAQR